VADAKRIVRCNPYVVVEIGEHKIRTCTIFDEDTPVWDAEYSLNIEDPDKVQSIRATIWNEPKKGGFHARGDEVIGQVIIPLQDLRLEMENEAYFPLSPISFKDYIAGDVHLRMQYTPPALGTAGELKIEVIEARNLAPKDTNGTSDPYVTIKFGKKRYKTKVVKRTLNPHWGESFTIPIVYGSDGILRIILKDWNAIGGPDFLGQITIPIVVLPKTEEYDRWYILKPKKKKDKTKKPSKKNMDLGSIRLKLKYMEEVLFPIHIYDDLIQYLIIDEHIIGILMNIDLERALLSKALVGLFESQKRTNLLLGQLLTIDVAGTNKTNLLFRRNSLATKSLDVYMRLIGKQYLHSILQSTMQRINSEAICLEVDAGRLGAEDEEADVEANMKVLVSLVDEIFNKIISGALDCPMKLRTLFHLIAQSVETAFPDDPNIKYTAISGFLFLRYFCPAILSPKLAGILTEHPSLNPSRTFTLIAKTLQNIASLVRFGQKEPFMAPMNEFLNEKFDVFKQYIDTIIDLSKVGRNIADHIEVDPQKYSAVLYKWMLRHKEEILANFTDEQNESRNHFLQVLDGLDNFDVTTTTEAEKKWKYTSRVSLFGS